MQLGTHLPLERRSTLRLTLVQAVSSGDRMDYTLQKAVELGISAIQPVFSERSVVDWPANAPTSAWSTGAAY